MQKENIRTEINKMCFLVFVYPGFLTFRNKDILLRCKGKNAFFVFIFTD